jgi:hypothetical protein
MTSYEVDGDSITFTSDGSATSATGDIHLWESVVLDDVQLHEDLPENAKFSRPREVHRSALSTSRATRRG